MIETHPPTSPAHLPWFITEPGQVDTLMVFTGVFLLLFTVAIIRLMLRLIVLPATLVSPEQRAKFEVVGVLSLIALYTPGHFYWVAALLVAVTDIPDFASPLRRMADAVGRVARSPRKKKEIPPSPEKAEQQAAITNTAAQMVFVLGLLLAPAEVIAASCSSYYISEINLVSPGDTEAGARADYCWICSVEGRGREKRLGVLLAHPV